jgi:hypothetical protein
MEEPVSRPASNRLVIAALILGALSLAGLLFVPFISPVLGLGAIVAGVIAFRRARTGALQRPIAVVAVILGTVVVLSIIALVLFAGLLFTDSPGRPEVGTGVPLAQTDPDGDYVLTLMETRYYKRDREIVRTGFALVIMSQEPYIYPGPDETFIYLDITLRNATDDAITFAPVTQFWLADGDGRISNFPVYALSEEYGEMLSYPEDELQGVITLPAQSEVPILFETVISQDSRDVVLVFDPDPVQEGDEMSVTVPR